MINVIMDKIKKKSPDKFKKIDVIANISFLMYIFSFGKIYHAVHVSLARPVSFRPPP